jgi:hypothetical protein
MHGDRDVLLVGGELMTDLRVQLLGEARRRHAAILSRPDLGPAPAVAQARRCLGRLWTG